MQEYRNLEPEELATDSSFQRWKLGNDPVASAFWNEWVTQNPDKKELVEKAHFLLNTIRSQYEQSLDEKAQLSEREVNHEVRRLHQFLDQHRSESGKWFQFTPIRYGMAASLLVLLGLFGWYVLHPTY